jgi:hypothetical protein
MTVHFAGDIGNNAAHLCEAICLLLVAHCRLLALVALHGDRDRGCGLACVKRVKKGEEGVRASR